MAAPVIVPGAIWQPDPISQTPIGDLRWIILHTVVGTVAGSIGGRHYHIYLKANGDYIQIQDLNLRSAASVQANPYSIAIVAEDKGPAFPAWTGSNVPDYTPQQADSLKFILQWIMARYGLSVRAIRTSIPTTTGRGCGHHRLGIDGNFPNSYPYWGRQPGGQQWSLTTGKWCPGNRKIDTYIRIVNELAAPPPEDPEMPIASDVFIVRMPAVLGTTTCGLTSSNTQGGILVKPSSTNAGGRSPVVYSFEAGGGVQVPGDHFKGSVYNVIPTGYLAPGSPPGEWVVGGAVMPDLSGYTIITNLGGELNFSTPFTGKVRATAGSDKIQAAYYDEGRKLWLVVGEGSTLRHKPVE